MPIMDMDNIRLPAVNRAEGYFRRYFGQNRKAKIVVSKRLAFYAIGMSVSVEQACRFKKQKLACDHRKQRNKLIPAAPEYWQPGPASGRGQAA